MGRLEHLRAARLTAVRGGRMQPDTLLVRRARFAGSVERHNLRNLRNVRLWPASGSAHADILLEAKLLWIDYYFDGIYGSAPTSLTKAELLARLVSSGIPGAAILTFGDGRVQTEATKTVGGFTVGVASDEPDCAVADEKKRGSLMSAGADYIIPDFLEPGLAELVLSGEC